MVYDSPQSQWADIIRERIVRDFDPQRVVLFGSRARGNAAPDSDFDVLVIFRGEVDRRRKAIDIRHALKDLPVGKDVIVSTMDEINRRGNMIGSVLRSALREGVVLFERN